MVVVPEELAVLLLENPAINDGAPLWGLHVRILELSSSEQILVFGIQAVKNLRGQVAQLGRGGDVELLEKLHAEVLGLGLVAVADSIPSSYVGLAASARIKLLRDELSPKKKVGLMMYLVIQVCLPAVLSFTV